MASSLYTSTDTTSVDVLPCARVLSRYPTFMVGLLLACAITALAPAAHAQTAWINEFHYDNDGTDVGEFVEIVIANAQQYPIDEFSLYLINGSDGTIYDSVSGSAFSPGASDGLFTVYTWAPSSLQNGPDGIALAHSGTLLDFISYEGSFTGAEIPVLHVPSLELQVEETTTTPRDQSLQLQGAGSGTDTFTWVGPADASPGTVNMNQELHALPLQIVPAPASSLPGDTVHLSFVLGSPQHPASDIIGAGFQIQLDTTLFTLLELIPGGFLTTDTLTFRRIRPAEGTIAYSVTTTDSTAARSGVDTLATVHVRIEQIGTADTTVTFGPYDMMATEQSGRTLALTPMAETLTITSAPNLQLSTTAVDFGVVDVTSTAIDSLLATNTGDAPLTVREIAVRDPRLAVEPSTFTLGPGESQRISISFRPSGDSAVSDTLLISSDDPDRALVKVSVEGETGAVVWPGDTDNDGRVDAFDLLPIGQHFGRTGPARTDRNLAWLGALVTPWTPVAASYADATGDGLVSQNDIQPIGLNYNRRRAAGKTSAGARSQVLSLDRLAEGSMFTLEVTVPDDRPVADMLGVGFDLSYSPELMEAVDVEHALGVDGEQVLEFEYLDDEAGVLEAAYTRKRTSEGIVASGTLASVTFRAKTSLPSGTAITLERAATSSREDLDLSPHVEMQSDAAVPDTYPASFILHGSYPNPFNSSTTVVLDLPDEAVVDLTVYDPLGRAILRLPARQLTAGYGRRLVVNAPHLSSGTYFYRVRAVTANTAYRETGTFTLLK